jgi:hypothetical protein
MITRRRSISANEQDRSNLFDNRTQFPHIRLIERASRRPRRHIHRYRRVDFPAISLGTPLQILIIEVHV